MTSQDDLLQQFIDNEKKSKQTTLLVVFVFMIAAFSILFLAYRLNTEQKVNNQLKLTNDYIQKINDSLNEAISNHFERSSINLDENNAILREQVKLLTQKLSEVEKDIGNKNSEQQINHIQQEIKQVTSNSKRVIKPEKSYTVFIQYNKDGNDQSQQINKIRKSLSSNGYNVPQEEFVNRDFKQTYVCYFYDEDSAYAKHVLEKIKPMYGSATLIKKDIKAPRKQIEIWVNSK